MCDKCGRSEVQVLDSGDLWCGWCGGWATAARRAQVAAPKETWARHSEDDGFQLRCSQFEKELDEQIAVSYMGEELHMSDAEVTAEAARMKKPKEDNSQKTGGRHDEVPAGFAIGEGQNEPALKLNIKHAVLFGDVLVLRGPSMKSGDVPLRKITDAGAQRAVDAALNAALKYVDARGQTVLQGVSTVLVTNPLDGALLNKANRLQAALNKGDMDDFLYELSVPDTVNGWDALSLLQQTLKKETQAVYLGGNIPAVRAAKANMETMMYWLFYNFSGEERALQLLASMFIGVIDAAEQGLLQRALKANQAPDFGSFDTVKRLKSRDDALFHKADNIFKTWLFPYMNKSLKNLQPQGEKAPAGAQAKAGSSVNPKDYLYTMTDEGGQITAYQAARPGIKRNIIYIALGLWNKLKNNPLALAQLLAHEAHHLDPQKPAASAKDEETAAEYKEQIVLQKYRADHPGVEYTTLRSILPNLHPSVADQDKDFMIRIGCPGCGRKLKVKAEAVGGQVRCPNCGHRFPIRSAPGAAPAPAGA